MNYKFRTLEWWSICIWFMLFGLWSAVILFGKYLSPLNITILITGVLMMFICAQNEEEWFPSEPQGEEET